jgi:hypothetical protein
MAEGARIDRESFAIIAAERWKWCHHGIDVAGPAEFKKVRAQLLEAFPDLRVVVEATAADGQRQIERIAAWNSTFARPTTVMSKC